MPERSKILKTFPTKRKDNNLLIIIIASLIVVLIGAGTGWFLSGFSSPSNSMEKSEGVKSMEDALVQKKDEAGLEDTSEFPDTVEGLLAEGGVEGEGTHHLERDGGPSQFVYMTSSVIDLQSFVGKKVKVWGRTISGQKAGWLMDVGKIKVTD